MIEILKNRGVLHVVGSDAGKFLQSMVTNNVLKNSYSYNYLLTNQGKFLFDFFVYKETEDSYWLDVDRETIGSLQKRLMMYKLRNDCQLIDASAEYQVLYSKEHMQEGVKFSLQDPRYEKLGYRSIISAPDASNLHNLTDDLYILDKYDYAIIDGSVDLVYERSIPIEYGAEELKAVDYRKGCYIGQEVISRVKYQGVVRKKIFKIKADSDLIIKEERALVLDFDGEEIGVVCSMHKNLAIALLNEEKFLGLKQKTAMIEGQVVRLEIPAWR
jgi:hypothetical protein